MMASFLELQDASADPPYANDPTVMPYCNLLYCVREEIQVTYLARVCV